MYMKHLIYHFLLAGIVFISFHSLAASTWCNGTIKHTYIDSGGTLFISGTWRNQHTAVCNVNNARLEVTPETCMAWVSLALAAKLSQTKVVIHYADVPSCSAIPQYNTAPRPSYLMLSE